jgi:hypothetical protein
MSYSTPQRFGDEACSPGACGSGVWASRDPQAAKGGQAATTTPTPGRQPATTHANRTKPNFALPGRLAWWTDAADRNAIDSHPATRSAETAAEGGTSRAHTGHCAANRIPRLRRAGPQGHGGVSVAVPESSPPDPRLHHDGLPTQRFITRSRCR